MRGIEGGIKAASPGGGEKKHMCEENERGRTERTQDWPRCEEWRQVL